MLQWRLTIINHLEKVNGPKITGGMCLDRNTGHFFLLMLQNTSQQNAGSLENRIEGL